MESIAQLSTPALVGLTLVLGLRHGLDADHLSCIDGLTRFNQSQARRVAPWCGTLFSVGHSAMIVIIATIIGAVAREFEPPEILDRAGTIVSVALLVAIGSMNVWNLLRAKPGEDIGLAGVKNRFLPKFLSQTSSPLVILLIGACFALAADTFSQAALFGLAGSAASNHSLIFPTILGLIFMAGMVVTDSIDGRIVFRMLAMAGRTAWIATRVTGWIVVALAYGVAAYEVVSSIRPDVNVNSELLGIALFCALLAGFGVAVTVTRREQARVIAR